MSNFYVLNSEGEKEPFSFKKIYRSAKRVGASSNLARKVAKEIEKRAFSGIKTSEIFKQVKELLSQEALRPALKFSLKEAMRKLGPTGFPFEKYIGKILSTQNFKIEINRHVSGFCCSYEIDFLAEKNNLIYIGECKYRNLPGGQVHLDYALSNHARFLDIKKGSFFNEKLDNNFEIKSLLVTNAKFTTNAIKYSRCAGVELLGWGYPKNKGLENLIESQKLYPITILPSLKKNIADIFVQKGIMLAQDILRIDSQKFSQKTKIPLKYLLPLIKEAEILLISDKKSRY